MPTKYPDADENSIKTGRVCTYIDRRMADRLERHGPKMTGNRDLSRKITYIVEGWDSIISERSSALMDSVDADVVELLISVTEKSARSKDRASMMIWKMTHKQIGGDFPESTRADALKWLSCASTLDMYALEELSIHKII